MHIRRLILLIAVAATALAACAGAPAQPSANGVTAASAATTVAPTTSTAAPAATAPATGIVTTAPNDATQARLRVSNCISNGPNVDMVVNGAVAVNGGSPQANLRALFPSGYLYLTPGTL